MKYTSRYGERVVEVYPYRPHPSVYDDDLWRVSIDGDVLIECFIDLADAKKRAEEDVGVPLRWEVEATSPPSGGGS